MRFICRVDPLLCPMHDYPFEECGPIEADARAAQLLAVVGVDPYQEVAAVFERRLAGWRRSIEVSRQEKKRCPTLSKRFRSRLTMNPLPGAG